MECLKLSFTIMIDRDLLCNRNINYLSELVQSTNPDSENELNFIEHSLYYSDQEYKACIARTNGELRMLNLNIGGLNSKFDKFKLFLAECNDDKLGYEPAGLTVHPPPPQNDRGWVHFFSYGCLVSQKKFPKKRGFCRRYSHWKAPKRGFTS